MNNTGQGLRTVEASIDPGTQVLRGMSAAIEADPTYDAAILAADRVDSAAVNSRDLNPKVLSQSKFQHNHIDNGGGPAPVHARQGRGRFCRVSPAKTRGKGAPLSSACSRKGAAPQVGDSGACLSLGKLGPHMPLCPDLVSDAGCEAGGAQPIQLSWSIAVQRGMRVLRRVVLCSFFTRWSGITFLYLRAGNFTDTHTRPLAAPTPKLNFQSSREHEHLRGELHWILFWLQFFRPTQRAQRLFYRAIDCVVPQSLSFYV